MAKIEKNESMSEIEVCKDILPQEAISFLANKLEEDQIIDIELIIDKLPKKQATLLKKNLNYILEWLA